MVAAPLPPGEIQFSDENGLPYAGGRVYFYLPSTFTPADTWQDYNQNTLNSNPITLDSAGRAIIWGVGRYRQILYKFNGGDPANFPANYTQVWDRETLGNIDNNLVSTV